MRPSPVVWDSAPAASPGGRSLNVLRLRKDEACRRMRIEQERERGTRTEGSGHSTPTGHTTPTTGRQLGGRGSENNSEASSLSPSTGTLVGPAVEGQHLSPSRSPRSPVDGQRRKELLKEVYHAFDLDSDGQLCEEELLKVTFGKNVRSD